MAQLFFGYFAGVIVLTAVLVVALRNPVYSALSLLILFFHVAGLYVTLHAEFLGVGILWRSAEGYVRAWIALIAGMLTSAAWVPLYGGHVGEGKLYGKPFSLGEQFGWMGGTLIVLLFLAAFYILLVWRSKEKMRKLAALKITDKHYQVDMRGWMCPYPKYIIESLVSKLSNGSRMDMLVDCPAATDDVPKVAQALGCSVPEIDQIGNGEWKIAIVKQ